MTEPNTEGVRASGPVAPTDRSVGQRMAKGAIWMALARGADRLVGLTSTVILARLLVPADFGLVAMATVVAGFLELFISFGFDTALIQNRAATRKHYDTAWTFNVLFGLGLALLLLLVSSSVASFYSEPRLTYVMWGLSLSMAIQGFENIGTVAFRKEMQFHREFMLIFARRLITFTITTTLAFMLRNYWALVVGIIVGKLMSVLLTYRMHSFRPRFSLEARHELFGFGKWLMLINILNFVSSRCADFLIGKIGGPRALGVFNMSYEIANMPTSDLIAPINRATFPGYAHKAGDRQELARSYLDVLGVVILLVLPAGTGIAAISDLLVPVALGDKWLDAIPVIRLLAFFGVFIAINSNGHYIYLAMGRSKIPMALGTTYVAILLPILTYSAWKGGALGAAIGYLVAQLLYAPIGLVTLCKVLSLRARDLGRVFYRPLLATATMYLVVHLLVEKASVATHGLLSSQFVALVLAALLGAIVYFTVLLGSWVLVSTPASAERRMLEYVDARFGHRLRRVFLAVRSRTSNNKQ